MYKHPIILPLDIEGTIYALQDEKGRTIGTGTRDVCEVLLHILRRQSTYSSPEDILNRVIRENPKPHVNIKSAVTI